MPETPRRSAIGLKDVAVLRDADPNSVWIVGEGDPAKVEEMLHDHELGTLMKEAGVTAPPEVFVVM